MSGARELGSFLGGQPLVSPPPRPPSDTERVRMLLRAAPDRWFTLVDIAHEAGIRIAHVNGTVHALVTRGQVERKLPAAESRRGRGQGYRWKAA